MSVFSKELIVYYRESCHLCEHVVASLFELQEELRFDIKQIDIDDNVLVSDETRKKFTADVPVVLFRDDVVFYHFFDEIAIRDALGKTT